jgi:hypothetical protein
LINNAYFDCFIRYAKQDLTIYLWKLQSWIVVNEPAEIHVLPHLWFRNFWKHGNRHPRPHLESVSEKHNTFKSSRNRRTTFTTRMGNNCFVKMKPITNDCITYLTKLLL